MSNGNNNDYSKGFVIGALVGGVAGALTALLLAPKPGAELRKDIADKSIDVYDKTSDYVKTTEKKVEEAVARAIDDGKSKAKDILKDVEGKLKSMKKKKNEEIKTQELG
jgi:gas vesicle protein